MRPSLSRRSFLKTSTLAIGAAAGLAPQARVLGANDDLRGSPPVAVAAKPAETPSGTVPVTVPTAIVPVGVGEDDIFSRLGIR